MSGTKWVGAPGFSNNAVNNRVTVTLRKKGDLLQVFVGQTKVAEYEKGIPPGLQFDAMSFDLAQAIRRMSGCSSATSGLRTTDPGEAPLTIED